LAKSAHWWYPRTWLAFMFWELRLIFEVFSEDGLSDWKATVVIAAFEVLAIVGLTNAAAVYLGRRLIDKGSPFIFVVAFAVATLNIPAMLSKHRRWHRLSTEFASYPAAVGIIGGVAVALLIAGAVVMAGHFGAAQHLLPTRGSPSGL
jgi:hypothetical protein